MLQPSTWSLALMDLAQPCGSGVGEDSRRPDGRSPVAASAYADRRRRSASNRGVTLEVVVSGPDWSPFPAFGAGAETPPGVDPWTERLPLGNQCALRARQTDGPAPPPFDRRQRT